MVGPLAGICFEAAVQPAGDVDGDHMGQHIVFQIRHTCLPVPTRTGCARWHCVTDIRRVARQGRSPGGSLGNGTVHSVDTELKTLVRVSAPIGLVIAEIAGNDQANARVIRSNGPALVVAPTSICLNWLHEIAPIAPTLTGMVLLQCRPPNNSVRPPSLRSGDRRLWLAAGGP